MPKIGKTDVRIDNCHHSDGRTWLRVNGRIIFEFSDKDKLGLIDVAKAVYRKLGVKIVDAAAMLASARLFTYNHPQFVRPYQWYGN